MRYFITFACYGRHLHGDTLGSVDRYHNLYGARVLEPDAKRASAERHRMSGPPYELDSNSRVVVLESLKQVCAYRGWDLLAAHVRSSHVHVVVECDTSPEEAMNDLKAYSTRTLNRLDGMRGQRRWARHGSTRWLWRDQDVREAIRYVVEEQGEAMAVFVGEIPK